MKKLIHKILKKVITTIIRRVITKRTVMHIDTKELYYPYRWELFGWNIKSGYIPVKVYDELHDEQCEYLGVN